MPNEDATPPGPRGALFLAVYERLREIAVRQLAGERSGHTLQATALVHEAWLDLGGDAAGVPVERGAFLAAATEAMRRILIDHARGRNRQKRGGGMRRVSLDPLELAARDDATEILSLDEAIEALAARDPRLATIARMRVYAGLEADDVAKALGVHARTVRRDWQLARAFLHQALHADTE